LKIPKGGNQNLYICNVTKKSLKIPKGGNQNLYIEEHTTQWPKEKVQKDKQRSTKHTHKTKDRVTRTLGSSYSTSSTSRVILVTNPVISHE